MYIIEKVHGGHQWEKQNLVTVTGRGRSFDVLKCACGLKGKSYSLSTINIPGNYSRKRVDRCPLAPKNEVGRIKITFCEASGPQFQNLTPGSEHDIIETPAGEHANNGVWVMGVGEPVKVLRREYTKL